MGKKKTKITASFKSTQDLGNQISEGRVAKQKNKKFDDIKLRYDEDKSEFIDPKITQRILNAAQKQRAELAKEFGPTPSEATTRGLYASKKISFADNTRSGDSDDEEEVDSGSEKFDDKNDYTEHDFFDELKINDEDERALMMFQNT